MFVGLKWKKVLKICDACHKKGFSVHFANFTAGEFESLNTSLPPNT